MRLIDADGLSTVTDIREDGTEFTYIPYSEIEEAPTAYDIDKVVEQLSCNECDECELVDVCNANMLDGFMEKICEIVKAGGKDD